MRIGPMRHRVTLQSQTQTQSGTGAITRVWANVATVWADIQPSKGKEVTASDGPVAVYDTTVYLRYSTDIAAIDTTWRVKYGTRTLSIESAINSAERDRMIVLRCTEGRKDDE